MVPKFTGIPYFSVAEKGARNAARDFDAQLIFTGPDSADVVKQEVIIEDLIKQKVDAICVSSNDPVGLSNVLIKARSSGIRVITWDSDVEKDAREAFVLGADPEQFGRHIMDYMAFLLGYKGEFAIVSGAVNAANINEWIYWTKDQLKQKYKDIKLLTVIPSDDNVDKAYTQTKNIIREYRGIDGIVGYAATAGVGVSRAIEELGLNGQVKVAAVATPNSIRHYLDTNACQVSVLYDVEKMGYLAVAVASKLITQDRVPEDGEDIPNVGKVRLIENNTVVLGDAIDITKENSRQFDY